MKYLLLLVSFSFILISKSEAFFYKEFGDSTFTNTGKSVTQLNDGFIYYGGYSYDGNGRGKISFSKMDGSGNIIFTKYYFIADTITTLLEKMIYANDGSFLFSGLTSELNGRGVIAKADTAGNLLWIKTYTAGLGNYGLSGIALDDNGNIYASGFAPGPSGMLIDFYALKTDPSGNIIWQNTFGEPDKIENSDACLVLADGNILIGGDQQQQIGRFNAYNIKLDPNGNFLDDLLITNIHNGGCKNMIPVLNGDIVIVGESATDSSADFDMTLTKIDPRSLTIKWQRYIRGTNLSDAAFSLVEKDNQYIVTGYGYDVATGNKLIPLVYCDTAGNMISIRYFGNASVNIGYQVSISTTGDILIAGGNFTDGKNILVYNQSTTSIAEIVEDEIKIFPNPIKEEKSLKIVAHNLHQLELYDEMGRLMKIKESIINHEIILDLKDFPAGIYFLKAFFENKIISERIIIP